jgi:small-conductance mechanosensitive channel
LENELDNICKENMSISEKNQILENNLHSVRIELESKTSDILLSERDNSQLRLLFEEEKTKNKNLIALIKDLEKKKSSNKVDSECKNLKEQVDFLTTKLKEIEGRFREKLEKKDIIIKKLDEKLVEYEGKLSNK